MKTITLPGEESIAAAAAHILSCIEKKKDAVIALGALDEELAVWDELCRQARGKNVSLSCARFFAVCEFEGETLPEGASVRQRLLSHLIDRSDAHAENLFIPDAEDCAGYDGKIAALGGLDLAVLGLGDNARVGFNEPATPFDSGTHLQKLTRKTRAELASRFGGEENVPVRGVTQGFQTLCFARDIVVIAHGAEKATALYRTLYGRDDSVYPAAFLQLPPNVTVYADEEAAASLNGNNGN